MMTAVGVLGEKSATIRQASSNVVSLAGGRMRFCEVSGQTKRRKRNQGGFPMARTRLLPLLLAGLASLMIAGVALAKSDTARAFTFTTTLSGAEEVNAAGVPNQGDLGGSGTATLTLNPGQKTICYTITLVGITPNVDDTPFAAHIHEAPAGVNGPVVVPLGPLSLGTTLGCVPAESRTIAGIIADPTGYYVNVHNTEFPGGALRGQLGD